MPVLSTCAAMARARDRERFAAALLAPPAVAEALCALLVVEAELDAAGLRAAEPALGRIRLQWWRDALADPAAHRRDHPALAVLAAHGLDGGRLDAAVAAREAEFEGAVPATPGGLTAHAEALSAPFLGAALTFLEAETEADARAAAGMGTAWGVVSYLRRMPFHACKEHLHLPLEAAEGPADGARDRPAAVRALGDKALNSLNDARHLRSQVSPGAPAALRLATPADAALRRLRRADWVPESRLVQQRWPRPLRLGLYALLRRF